MNYILNGEVPEDPMEERKVRNRAAWFTVTDGNLFRRAVEDTIPLRACVTQEEGKEILISAHSGTNGPHQEAKALGMQVTRQGYYWPQLNEDAENLVKNAMSASVMQTYRENHLA